MKKFKIEKNVKIPASKTAKVTQRAGYPFCSMKVGESFVAGESYTDVETNRIVANSSYWGKKINGKFIARKTDAGVRIWRVK